MRPMSAQNENILDSFKQFGDWTEKYNFLISLGKSLPQLDIQHKHDQYLIKGCQSKVWLHAEYRNGRIYYYADSDSVIIKGIIALLSGVFSDQYPQDVVDADFEFLEEIGLKNYLSPTRSNGLLLMFEHMKHLAKKMPKSVRKPCHQQKTP